MGDISGTSDKVFEIYRRYAENDIFPWDGIGTNLEDGGNLADLITLRSKSHYGKETAGSKNAGRSGTIQVGNMTEVAFWPMQGEKTLHLDIFSLYMMGIIFRLVVADSTPNGPNGWFYRTWVQDNEWAKIFAAWFEFEDSVIPFKSEDELQDFKDTMTEDEKSEMERFDVNYEQFIGEDGFFRTNAMVISVNFVRNIHRIPKNVFLCHPALVFMSRMLSV